MNHGEQSFYALFLFQAIFGLRLSIPGILLFLGVSETCGSPETLVQWEEGETAASLLIDVFVSDFGFLLLSRTAASKFHVLPHGMRLRW